MPPGSAICRLSGHLASPKRTREAIAREAAALRVVTGNNRSSFVKWRTGGGSEQAGQSSRASPSGRFGALSDMMR